MPSQVEAILIRIRSLLMPFSMVFPLASVSMNVTFNTLSSELTGLMAGRTSDPLFTNTSVRHSGSTLVFVYKAAAEIGELGDNTKHMRDAVSADALLRSALSVFIFLSSLHFNLFFFLILSTVTLYFLAII